MLLAIICYLLAGLPVVLVRAHLSSKQPPMSRRNRMVFRLGMLVVWMPLLLLGLADCCRPFLEK